MSAEIMRKKEIRDIVGSSHVRGMYNFTDKDYLNEGADVLLEMGSRVIKLWLHDDLNVWYPFNSQWPKMNDLVDMVKMPYYREALAKPFTTIIFETYAPGREIHYYRYGMKPEDIEWEKTRIYDLAKHLLTEYKNTGKTFIIQNWEGDWILTNPQFTKEPDPVTVQGMIDWLNARQDAVDAARADVGMEGVTVAHAGEVNLIMRAIEGKVTVTNNVVPYTHCDLYSYSAYDSALRGPKEFRDALDYLASKAPPSKLYGKNNVFVGEYGAPENEFDQLGINKYTVETALDWGAHYVVYWEVFCNEPATEFKGRPTNTDCRGFWLVRPDGAKPPIWDYFVDLLK